MHYVIMLANALSNGHQFPDVVRGLHLEALESLKLSYLTPAPFVLSCRTAHLNHNVRNGFRITVFEVNVTVIFDTCLRFLASVRTALARRNHGWLSADNPNILMGAFLPCTFCHDSENGRDGENERNNLKKMSPVLPVFYRRSLQH